MTTETLTALFERGRAAAQLNVASVSASPCLGGCGEKVLPPKHICDDCSSKQARAERHERSFWTVPESFRWARFGAPELSPPRIAHEGLIPLAMRSRDAHYVALVGPAGTGKTSLACAMMRARIDAVPDRSALFLSAMRLGIARSRSEDSEPHLVAKSMRVDLLLIDDLGNESEVPSNPIKEIVWKRWDDHRATWITTGLGLEAIALRYGDGMARRLFERGVIDCGKP